MLASLARTNSFAQGCERGTSPLRSGLTGTRRKAQRSGGYGAVNETGAQGNKYVM